MVHCAHQTVANGRTHKGHHQWKASLPEHPRRSAGIPTHGAVQSKEVELSQCHPCRLLDLPYDIREQILMYLLPSESLIDYQCPYGIIGSQFRPSHERLLCGQGPGWSCLRERKHRPLDFLRVCRHIYVEASRLLWDRTFVLELSEGLFRFINRPTPAFDCLRNVPWMVMRSIQVQIAMPTTESSQKDVAGQTNDMCHWLSETQKVRRLDVQLRVSESPQVYDRDWSSTVQRILAPYMVLKAHRGVDLVTFHWQVTLDQRSLTSLPQAMDDASDGDLRLSAIDSERSWSVESLNCSKDHLSQAFAALLTRLKKDLLGMQELLREKKGQKLE